MADASVMPVNVVGCCTFIGSNGNLPIKAITNLSRANLSWWKIVSSMASYPWQRSLATNGGERDLFLQNANWRSDCA